MRSSRDLFLWVLGGVIGAALLAWSYPRVYPFMPQDWRLSKQGAQALALEQLRALGDPVPSGYIVTHLDGDPFIERRLLLSLHQSDAAALRRSPLGKRVEPWEVIVYPPGAGTAEWTYSASLAAPGSSGGTGSCSASLTEAPQIRCPA
jgi:hypothetical protein